MFSTKHACLISLFSFPYFLKRKKKVKKNLQHAWNLLMLLTSSLIAKSKLWFTQWILANHDLWSAILVRAPKCTPKLT